MSNQQETQPASGASLLTDGLEDIVLVFDKKLKRPACVLLQAVYGCGHNNGFLQMTFDSNTWLVAPTPDMVRVRGTREQWKRAAAMSSNV